MTLQISEKYVVMFIVFVSLGIYYPSIFGTINSTDDYRMITDLINTNEIPWKGIFLSGGQKYYRPVLSLSFFFDRFMFGCHEFFMHLENVLLHTLNGVLVFFMVKEFRRIFEMSSNLYVPMFSALFFILHPVNTESVNWISGRTDVLAGLFIFLSLLVFLKKGMTNYVWRWIAAFFYLMGLLSKEVAFGLLPILGIFLFLNDKNIMEIRIKDKIKMALPFLLITIIYLLVRFLPAGHSEPWVSTASKVQEANSGLMNISIFIKVFGFYIKKLFIPLPLNFGIMDINQAFYFWFGLSLFGMVCYLFLKRRTLLPFFLFFSIVFFLPALPVAIYNMAWTPLAERYLYISSFGSAVLLVSLVDRVNWGRELIHGAMVILLVISAVVTVKRNIIWQDNIVLYEDTVKKSPRFAGARNEYGIALANRGRLEEAMKQFEKSKELAGNIKYKEMPSLNMLTLRGNKANPEEKKDEYLKLLDGSTSPQSSREILYQLVRLTEDMLSKEKDAGGQKILRKEMISYLKKLYEFEGNGFYLYKIGQSYLLLGEKDNAIEFYKKSYELSPNEYYSESALKQVKKLESQDGN